MKFTKHAVDRYMQFHLLDDQTPDWRDVLALLEENAASALKLKEKTKGGQTQWLIESLGAQLITKHDDGEDVVVTILPPVKFRGLTPLQAEAMANKTEELKFQEEMLRSEQAEIRVKHPIDGPKQTRLSELNAEISLICHEREVLVCALKTMRVQLKYDDLKKHADVLSEALQVTLRFIRDNQSLTDALDVVRALSPDLASDEFIDGDRDTLRR